MTSHDAAHYTLPTLVKAALPSMGMTVFSAISVVVDGFFVSNAGGTVALAAVNIAYPPIMVLGAIGYMLGTGGSALVAKTRGEGDEERADAIFSLLTWFAAIIGVAIAGFGFGVLGPLCRLMGADGELLKECIHYGMPLVLVMPFFLLQYFFQSLSVTAGKPQIALYAMLGAGSINMVLDFLFVGVMGWGAGGAGVATAMSFVIGGAVPLVYFCRENPSYLQVHKPSLPVRDSVAALLKSSANGSSEMVAQISVAVVGMLFNYQLMRYLGQDGVAAYSTIMYVACIFNALYLGFALGTSPLMSFEFGAKNSPAQQRIFRSSVLFYLIVGVALVAASEAFAEPLTQIFLSYDESLRRMAEIGFRLYALAFLPLGLCTYASALFTAVNNGAASAVIAFARTLVFEAAAVALLPLAVGIQGIWLSTPLADLGALVVAVVLVAALGRKEGFLAQKGRA